MSILLDTQTIVWVRLGDTRLSVAARDAIVAGEDGIFISAVTAYEFADLDRRGRFGPALGLESIIESLSASILDFPAPCWQIASELPDLHRDPVDRMLIAHAIHAGMTLVTADETIRRYPVATLW